MRRAVLSLAVLIAAGALAGCGGGSSKGTTSTTTTSAAGGTAKGCVTVAAPAAAPKKEAKPTSRLSPTKTYDVTMKTNCGSFTFRIDQKESPNASASFVSLVQHGFFNQTIFHRIVTGFVIQGGDPTATGNGGPGYTTVDTPPKNASYTLGTVAMAKTATAPAGTAGSQFFIVTTGNAGLTPDYAIIGKVIKGIAVVERIGKLGTPDEQGTPTQVVEIEQASVKIS